MSCRDGRDVGSFPRAASLDWWPHGGQSRGGASKRGQGGGWERGEFFFFFFSPPIEFTGHRLPSRLGEDDDFYWARGKALANRRCTGVNFSGGGCLRLAGSPDMKPPLRASSTPPPPPVRFFAFLAVGKRTGAKKESSRNGSHFATQADNEQQFDRSSEWAVNITGAPPQPPPE